MTPRVLALVLLATTTPVHGDDLHATRAQPVREVAHTVEVRIVDGVAKYVVQRRFENRGNTADEVNLTIALPKGAAATGLRIRAKQRWHDGELLDRETAAGRYRELTGQGIYDPKDPALLFWESSDRLNLQVFPVMPKTVSTVEYTLTVPTAYRDGRYQLAYPRAVRVEKRAAGEEGPEPIQLLDPTITFNGGRITLPTLDTSKDTEEEPPQALASFSVAPPAIPIWQARLGRVVASEAHAFARLELDLAPQLSSLPRKAHVVFVIDASHSAGPKAIEAQLAIARAYVQHVPDAQIELVAYRRTASRVFGRFVPASSLAAAIREADARKAFAPGNGSALDEGARAAAVALANRVGPRRVVLLTDELVRTTLAPATALAALSSLDPAIAVHVVVPEVDAGEAKLSRDDEAELAPLATKHHGIFARLAVSSERELVKPVLELVRPIRIDHLGHDDKELALAESMREGEGVRLFEQMSRRNAPVRLTIRGQLWSDPITLDVPENTTFSRATAGFVFGANLHDELSEVEMMVVALMGRVVSPVTSYLAIEPGVRPSTIGLADGGSGWGTIGSGRYGTIGRGSGSGSVRLQQPDLSTMIATAACVKKHAPLAGWSVKLEVETTRDEIVDVRVRNGFGAMADCLVEATWGVRLDARFVRERDTLVVDLQ